MKLQDFHLAPAAWSREGDQEALRDIRMEVFVVEQNVPESLEWDELDADSVHILARDDAGRPIACGRLTPLKKIGRMAVRQDWRGSGVGRAILRELVARARSQGLDEVRLDAQVAAIGFYEREGFEAYGDVFDDAGIPHRGMRLALAGAVDSVPPAMTPSSAFGTRAELTDARVANLQGARHTLCMYQPLLDGEAFATPAEIDALRQLATSGRGASIRLLIHDPDAALRDGHRLIGLAQRLPSVIQVRTPVEELDLAYGSAYLLNDQGGFVFQPEANRPIGRTAAGDRAGQAPLLRHFEQVWERAARATVLQPLDL